MACVGRTKQCTLVPPNHFGPIPGVEVGSQWKFRVQVTYMSVCVCVRVHVVHEPEGLTGTIRGRISTIHFWKADILSFIKNPGGRLKAVA